MSQLLLCCPAWHVTHLQRVEKIVEVLKTPKDPIVM
jgi:hypothetical protein